MHSTVDRSAPERGRSPHPAVQALVGVASAACVTPGSAAVIGWMDLDHQVLDGESFVIPGTLGPVFRNKGGGCLDAFSGVARIAYTAFGEVIGPGTTTFIQSYRGGCSNSGGFAAVWGVGFVDTDGEHYGWVDWEINFATDSLVIHSYGYETTARVPITVGDVGQRVPEPGALALAAAGLASGLAAGLSGRRRRARRSTPA